MKGKCKKCGKETSREVYITCRPCSNRMKAIKNIGNKYRLGKIPWNKGKQAGSLHPLWKSDRTSLKTDRQQCYDGRYREWMRQVKNRDYWKCQISNDDCSGRVEAHHILGWRSHPELRYEIKNGITLCHFHHPRKRSEEERLAPIFTGLVLSKLMKFEL